MLNLFRRRETAVRFILGAVLLLVCVSMVVTLVPGILSGNGGANANHTVATVAGVAISATDLSNQIERDEAGRQIPPSLAPLFGREILRGLITDKALGVEAHRLGLTATDEEVVQEVRREYPELFPKGHFIGQQRYRQFVEGGLQMSVQQYEEGLRQQIMERKLYHLVTDNVQVSPAEVHQEFLKRNEKAVFNYVVLNPSELEGKIQPTPQQLQAYYQQHQAAYRAPEKRVLEVVLANTMQIAAAQHVSEAAIDSYYARHRQLYSTPERVKVRHILFKTTGDTPAQVAAAKAKAESVLAQLKKGADFGKLAKQYSQDPGSAAQGGELGWIQRGQTVPQFQHAAFSLKPGQLSGLIQTMYGFHIIQVEAHQPAQVQTLAQVHDQIQSLLQQRNADIQVQQIISRANSQAQSQPLAAVAQKFNLQYFKTPAISKTDPVAGIGVNPDFVDAAFSTDLGGVTPVVQVAEGYAFAKVDRIQPPQQRPFADVAAEVRSEYTHQQAQTLAQQEARQLVALAATKGLKAAAAALHAKLETSTPMLQSGSLPDLGAISSFARQLFAQQPNQTGGPVAVNGKQVVYSLVSLQPPASDLFQQQAASIKQSLLQQKRSEVFRAFSDALNVRWQRSGKIKINVGALAQVLGGAPAGPNAPGAPTGPGPLGL